MQITAEESSQGTVVGTQRSSCPWYNFEKHVVGVSLLSHPQYAHTIGAFSCVGMSQGRRSKNIPKI